MAELPAGSVTLVDDGSVAFVRQWLKAFSQEHGYHHLSHENRGFGASVNRAIEASDEEWVLVVNSDTELPPGAVQRLVAAGESSADIGMVNPLTNYAAQISLARPPGWSYPDVDRWLEAAAFPAVDVVTAVGFCLLIRRKALRSLGSFDEAYGRGYCEDSDLAMRFLTAGWRNIVAQNVYVFHQGQGSFADRDERYRHNRALFDARWQASYGRLFAEFKRGAPLQPLRAKLNSRQRRESKAVIWATGREVRKQRARGNWPAVLLAMLRGLKRLCTHKVPAYSEDLEAERPAARQPSVVYLLDSMVIAGGVMSVIQLVNSLIRMGVDARIATRFKDPVIDGWMGCLAEPMVFDSERGMLKAFPRCDVVVATLWTTMPWAKSLVGLGRAAKAVAFVQDYEPWFVREEQRNNVINDYAAMDVCVVKSVWLECKLAEHGARVRRIGLGLDRLRYFPSHPKRPAPTVLAMARPGTAWRGFDHIVEALRLLKARRPDVEAVFFGADVLPAEDVLGFHCENAGVVDSPAQLSRLYSQATVFLDGSDFQGFGRCGLEAMACATACVLTREGGVGEYARDGINCLLVDPRQPKQWAQVLERLLDDQPLRQTLVAGGLATLEHWSHQREAAATRALFESLCSEQMIT